MRVIVAGVLAVAMGAGGVLLGLWLRQPISIAWSTPGAALLVTSGVPDGGFSTAVGAMLAVGRGRARFFAG